MRRTGAAALVAICLVVMALPAAAQENLLTNGGMEQGEFGPYVGKGRADLNVPVGWDLWLGQGTQDQFFNRGDKTFSFPHPGPSPSPVEGGTAANLSGGFVQFNAAYFQTVNGIAEGANIRAEAASQVKACDLGDASFCGSDFDSGAQTRIGIDPDGGTNPNAPEIVWSNWVQPHDTWQRQSVEATASGSAVTVFLYATQNGPYEINKAYFDDASLTQEGGGGTSEDISAEGDDPENTAVPPTNTPPPFAPFVNPQGEREDGSIVHTVGEGDTLLSIAVGYGVSATRIAELNPELSGGVLRVGQQLIIRPATPPPAATAVAGDVITAEASDEQATDTQPPSVAQLPTTASNQNSDAQATAEVDQDEVIDALGDLFEDVATEETAADDSRPAPIMSLADVTRLQPRSETNVAAQAARDLLFGGGGEVGVPGPTQAGDSASAEAEGVTQAPAATQLQATSAPQVDFTASTASVCVSLFEDVNQNRLREAGEDLLADGEILLNTAAGEQAAIYTTNGESEPHCFGDLDPAEYTAVVRPPSGFGLTTPNNLRLPLTSGTSLNIEFGAAEGLQVAEVPANPDAETADTPQENTADEVLPAQADFFRDNIVAISGIIVAALVGIVLVAGIGAAVLLRRTK